MVEPFRALREPRVVGGALDGEVERYVQAEVGGALGQSPDVVARAEVRMDGVVAAAGVPDRPRGAGVPRCGAQRVVTTLAPRHADRMDRRQVDDIEAELGELRQLALDTRQAVPGAGEQLIPGTEPGAHTVDLDRQRR